MERPIYEYVGAIVVGFVVAGIGVGLAANFSLGFFIEQLVDPGADPLDNQFIGLLLLTTVFLLLVFGPLIAGAMSLAVGRALPDRRSLAAAVGAVGSIVGFLLMTGIAMYLSFAVLAEYAPVAGGGGAGGGSGGGGGGGPFNPRALATPIGQIAIPVGVVGAAAGYIGSRLTIPPSTTGASYSDPNQRPGDEQAGSTGLVPDRTEGPSTVETAGSRPTVDDGRPADHDE